MKSQEALEPADVPGLLVDLGVFPAGSSTVVRELAGGVSSYVYLAEADGQRVVVKKARARLTVEDEWLADPRRAITEARAARLLGRVAPGKVPAVVAVDEERHLFVMQAAPEGTTTWKEELLAGSCDPGVASEVGRLLATIHEATRGRADVLAEFGNKREFDDLRVDAYLRTVAARHRDLAGVILPMADSLLAANATFVHGDFSPKNILLTPERKLLLVDHEVAHAGDPAFDLAFFLPHLTIKSLRFEADQDGMIEVMAAFLGEYSAASSQWPELTARVPRLLAAMTLARIDGKSPVEYLTEGERDRVRRFARKRVLDPAADLHSWLGAVGAEAM